MTCNSSVRTSTVRPSTPSKLASSTVACALVHVRATGAGSPCAVTCSVSSARPKSTPVRFRPTSPEPAYAVSSLPPISSMSTVTSVSSSCVAGSFSMPASRTCCPCLDSIPNLPSTVTKPNTSSVRLPVSRVSRPSAPSIVSARSDPGPVGTASVVLRAVAASVSSAVSA